MKKLVASWGLVALLTGCVRDDSVYEISDVTQSETIILEKDADQDSIYAWSLHSSGNIEGEAEIVLMLDGEAYRTEKLSGAVTFQWEGDWYADQAEISYNPISVTSGSLTLNYRFYD